MILAFTRFDLASWLPRMQTLLPLALVVAAGIAVPVPGMAIVSSALVTSLMVSAPFLGDERARLDTLYGVLPVSRTTVLVGRTLAILAYGALSLLLALVVTVVVVALVRGAPVEAEWPLTFVGIAAGFVGLSLSIQLPVLFSIGYARGRFVAYAPAAVVAGGAWLGQAVVLIGGGATEMPPVAPVVVAGLAVGAAGTALGALLAARAYRAREIR